MKPSEAIELSLAGVFFAYNNRYAVFKDSSVRCAYRKLQLLDVNAVSENEFDILTNNALLSSLQTHALVLNDYVKAYCKRTVRAAAVTDDPQMEFLREFVSKLRNATLHFSNKFLKLTWQSSFQFFVLIPVEEVSKGSYSFKANSKMKRKIQFRGTKGHELRITRSFFHRLILLSFHVKEIVSFKKKSNCNEYLERFRGRFLIRGAR